MKFELKEYHRNVNDEELLEDLRKVASEMNSGVVTREEYNSRGRFSESTLRRRLGSWTRCLELAGLTIAAKQRKKLSDEDYIQDLKRVAKEIGKSTVTTSEYEIYGKYDRSRMSGRFGSWASCLLKAGLEQTGFDKNITNDMLMEEIENLWISLGRQPTCGDIKNGQTQYSLNTYTRRFGSWRNALESFIEYINEELPVEEIDISPNEASIIDNITKIRHTTNRDINLRLRFIVMRRDSFKCCICGDSPAKNPNTILHIDHIVPWAKGGETIESNLQTLCLKCNFGKSDLI